jgi:hypothetical protein
MSNMRQISLDLTRLVAAALLVTAGGTARAQRIPISPNGIPYTLPAEARAAGWTVAEPGARTAFLGSNPVFLAGGSRFEVVADLTWQQRDLSLPQASLDEFETRLGSLTGKAAFGALAVGLSYQKPFHALLESSGLKREDELQTFVAGAALDVLPTLRAGASLARIEVNQADTSSATYQATFGAEVELVGASVAAAVKTRLFGADAKKLDAPLWVQLDARLPLGPLVSLGVRAGFGDWKNRDLRNPADLGLGVRWKVLPILGVLAGVHSIRDRTSNQRVVPLSASDLLGISLDEGTYLDVGAVLGIGPAHVALAVEDNRFSNPDVSATTVTLTGRAAF